MSFLPLKIPPGIFRNGTRYQSIGRWFDANLVRWTGGTMRPFGGWTRVTNTLLAGAGRGILTWRPSTLSRLAAIGTPSNLYIWDDDSVYDITPTMPDALSPGNPDTFYGVGYGFGDYGAGPYGESSGSGGTDATSWSLDTWGDYLVACASHDHTIWEWQGDVSMEAAKIAGAPSARAIIVTAERILVALGAAGDLRAVAWSDIEDNTSWVASASNSAGDQRIQTDGTIITGRRVRGTNLIFTTTDLHKMTFVGQPYIYSFEQVSKNCGLVAPLAVQEVNGGAFWMGQKNFFQYAGGQVKSLDCDVEDYVFGDINFDQAAKFSSGHIAAFGEVLWFYCGAGSTEIDRCVAYNYREGHWAIHPSLSRGCWADVGSFRYPLAVSPAGRIYQQESGWLNDSVPILTGRFAESGPVEIGSGDQVVEATYLIPDQKDSGQMQITFGGRFTPLGAEYVRGPYAAAAYTPIRVTARQVSIKLESLADADFRFGLQRLDAKPGSRR